MSISTNEEYFITSDELSIFLWDIEERNKPFTLLNINQSPKHFEELTQIITCCKYDKKLDSKFLYCDSKGVIKVVDLRTTNKCNDDSSLVMHNPHETLDKKFTKNRPFINEIVESISDAEFSSDGRYIFCRDFLNVYIWDIHMTQRPLEIIPIYEPLKYKLGKLYENESIFNKFSISSSPSSEYF